MEDKLNYSQGDTIFALATPAAVSAIAIVRVSGNSCIEAMSAVFSRPTELQAAKGNTIVYGFLEAKKDKSKIDEVLISVFRAPHSYTGENSIEINCHGGIAIQTRITRLLLEIGLRPAAPGEFSFRAFLNKKMDLTEAEGVHELINAKSEGARTLALSRVTGSIRRAIDDIRKEILFLEASITVQLDYPEEDLEEDVLDPELFHKIQTKLQNLLNTYQSGKLQQEGVQIVFSGKTNAGKSSLFNLFLKEERSIVSDIHGTTRDYIESHLSMRGIFIKLYDTAGLRESNDMIEQEGIRRSQHIRDNADLILYVIDGSQDLHAEEKAFYNKHKYDSRYIFIWNKADIKNSQPPLPNTTPMSGVENSYLSQLETEILARVNLLHPVLEGDAVIESERQLNLLEKTLDAINRAFKAYQDKTPLDLVEVEMQEARESLSILTGDITNEDILDIVFSQFCLGK